MERAGKVQNARLNIPVSNIVTEIPSWQLEHSTTQPSIELNRNSQQQKTSFRADSSKLTEKLSLLTGKSEEEVADPQEKE